MNSYKVKIQIGLVFILFSVIACERTEPENNLVITTDDIAVFSEGIYVFRGTIVSIGNEEIADHGFCWSESGNPVIEGSSICLGYRSTTGIFSSTIADFSANTTYYGALYTWPAAMHIITEDDIKPGKIQGVCPTGWHLPSDSEWKQLEMFLGMSSVEANRDDWRGTDEGGKMKHKGTLYWESPNTGASNESGFSAIPGGWRDGAGYFKNLGTATRFWSSSKRGDYAWIRQLDYNSSKIYRDTKGLYEAHSVRCIKDE